MILGGSPVSPVPAMTIRERYLAGLPARDHEERERYDEYDAASFRAPAPEDAYPDFAVLLGPAGDRDAALERRDLPGMSRKDAARWAAANNMNDLGKLVIAWMAGEITQTPGHCGPPCAETIPLIPVLTAVNRVGFVTESSQRAGARRGRTWNTWVCGWASAATATRLREAAAGTPLEMDACSRADRCGDCPREKCTSFWADACPDVAEDLRGAWWVYVEDPEPGRNDVLWPALARFADREWL